MRSSIAAMAAMMLLMSGAARVHGGTITYAITDIGSFTGYSTLNTTGTFTGTGFVGMYGPNSGAAQFAHNFGLEHSDLSRTELQVDTTALAGATIQSAILNFSLLDGSSIKQGMTITSFASNGILSYQFDPTNVLGSISGITNGRRVTSVDVTSLLNSSVASKSTWFALNLRGSNFYEYGWSYDSTNNVLLPDRPQVRLTVNYTSPTVTAPTTMGSRTITLTSGTASFVDGVFSLQNRSDQSIATPEPTTLASGVLAVGFGLVAIRRRRSN